LASNWKSGLLVALSGIAAACNGGASLQSAMGHYEGFMLTQVSGGALTQMSVSADATLLTQSPPVIALKIATTSGEMDFKVQATSDGNSIELDATPGILPAPLHLAKTKGNCFADAQKDSVCYDGNELSVNLVAAGLKLVMDRMAPTAMPKLETPQSYSIDQLIERARTENFDNKVELETLIQANLTAKNSFLNLLPHLNINVAMNAAAAGAVDPFNYLTMARSIGDLVPFILPDRWAGANAAKDSAAAEFDSYRIMQASAMNIVQGLALSSLRDEHALDCLGEDVDLIVQIRDLVKWAERNGGGDYPIGSSDQIDAVLLAIDLARTNLKQSLEQERTSLSQAAGFINPQAVAGVDEVAAPIVSGAVSGTDDDWRKTALARSLQLLQIDKLIESANAQKAGSFVQWLDPTGDDTGSIGPGMFSYVEIGSSKVRQLYDKRTESQSDILKSVDDALTLSQTIYAQYQSAVKSSTNAEGRINRFMTDFHGGFSFAMSDLVTALQDRAANDLNQVNAEYAFLTLQAQLNFLTFSGPYAQLLTEPVPPTHP
jgi:hypothetical protein